MSPIPKFQLIRGWVKEIFWILLVILTAIPGLFVKRLVRRGRRPQSIIVTTDALVTPLAYFRLASRLHRAGFSVLVVSTGHVFLGLREQARRLAALLDRYQIKDGILIGHGKGTLAALSLPDAGRQRLHHLISLGAPFNGSRLFMPIAFVPALRDMAVGSDYLLFNRMNCMLFQSFSPFSAWQDEYIIPFNLARYGQGRDLILDQVGRYNLVLGGDNLNTLIEFLEEQYPDRATAVEQARATIEKSDPRTEPPLTRGQTKTRGKKKSARKPSKKNTRSKAR